MIITKTQTGFSVEFAFELKDAFKAAFPTAKWIPGDRAWTVGVRSKKRLAQFAEEVKAAEQSIEEAEAVEIAGKKLEEVRELIAKASSAARSVAAQAGGLVAVKKLLSESQGELEVAESKEVVEREKLAAQQAEITKKLAGVVSIDRMIALQREMASNHDWKNGAKKDRFTAAQAEANEIDDKLIELGLRCDALVQLTQANINRPDRDGVGYIKRNEFFVFRSFLAET